MNDLDTEESRDWLWRRPRNEVAILTVLACLSLPFSWIAFMPGLPNLQGPGQLLLLPFLPGMIPAELIFGQTPEFPGLGLLFAAIQSVLLVFGFTMLAKRSRLQLILSAVLALIISLPQAAIFYVLPTSIEC